MGADIGRTVKFLTTVGSAARITFQETDAQVSFDPRETGYSEFTWQTLLTGLLLAFACVGAWKVLTWFIESRREHLNWRALRYWWPTTMLVWAWLILLMLRRSESWGWPFDGVLFVFGLVNLPVLALVGLLIGLCNDLPLWTRLLAGSLGMWAGNFLLVRLAEWRAWARVPVSMKITRS